MRLHLSRALTSSQRELITDTTAGLPSIDGGPVFVCTQPELTAQRGKLLSGEAGRGKPVFAASFIREGRIVLETSLFDDSERLRLILAHEVFHFAWPRLGNPQRRQYKELLVREGAARAKGELGGSSCVAKQQGSHDYACESFCDTGAYLYADVREHEWFTLAARWRNRREAWFRANYGR